MSKDDPETRYGVMTLQPLLTAIGSNNRFPIAQTFDQAHEWAGTLEKRVNSVRRKGVLKRTIGII